MSRAGERSRLRVKVRDKVGVKLGERVKVSGSREGVMVGI